MALKPKKKKKKKKNVTKFKAITFKLTARQKKSLDKNCKSRRTTPLKLIKYSIKNYLSLVEEAPPPVFYTARQLDLFAEMGMDEMVVEQPEKAEVTSA